MKKIIYLLIIFILTTFIHCKKQSQGVNEKSNKVFSKFISENPNSTKGIKRIDSILKVAHSLSPKKTGLLYYYKAEYLVDLNKYEHAIVNYKKGLPIFEKAGDQKNIAIMHNGLGRVNTTIKKFDIALEQLNFALDIFKKINDKVNELVALDGLAYLQFSQLHYSKAAEITNKLLTINIELKDSLGIARNYGNLGYISELLMHKKKAENYYKKAVFINRKIKPKNTIQLRNLGSFYLAIKQPKKCEALYLEALEIENKKENSLILKEIYAVLVDSINNKNIPNFSKFVIKQDSINTLLSNRDNEEKIKLIEDQYKLIAKEKELNQEKNINDKNKIIFASLIGILLLLGLFIYQKNRNKRLELNQEKIMLEQRVLRSQMNPHFIFNALTSIQKNLLEEDLLKSSTSLARFAKLIRQNFEFTSKKLIGLDEDLNALKNYIETQQLRFEDKFNYQINIQKGLDISYIKIPPMLLQPFVENAIEHGLRAKKEKGNLTINVFEKEDLIHFELIDDGVGFKSKKTKTDREHATDIFFKRLELRNLNEEKTFVMKPLLDNGKGTKIEFALKL